MAARMLDVTGCLTIGLAAVSVPAVVSPVVNHYSFVDDDKQTVADFDKDGGQMIAYAEHSRTDSNNDGKLDIDDYSAAALRVRSVTKPPTDKSGGRALSGDQEYDLLYASAKNGGTTWTNDSFSTNSSLEFSGLKASASNTYGKPGDGKNAAMKVSSTIQVAHAELKANAFSGNNDDMVGTKAEIGAGYETMKGEVAATGTTMSVNGYNMQVTGKASGSVESVGAAGAGLYYHKKEKRLYASLDVGLAIGLGLEGAFEVSIGQEYAPEDAPAPQPAPKADPYVNTPGFGKGGLPGTIIMGNMRVLIG